MDKYKEWYDSLNEANREKVDSLLEKLQAVGESNPLSTAYSEISEDLTQLVGMRFLYGLRQDIQSYEENQQQLVEWMMNHGFDETRPVIKKMLDNGISPEEIATLMKFSAYDGMYRVIMRLEDPRP